MTVILAAGQFPRTGYPRHLLGSADVVVCCDSALSALERHGIVPDAVVGDLDSVCSRALARYHGEVVRVCEQDTNDLTKAFRYVVSRYPGEKEIHILGATGRSEAHTLGNMALLMDYAAEHPDIKLDMVSDYSTMLALTDSAEIHVGEGRRVSLFSPDNSLRIKSKGLRWDTSGVVFDNWWKASLNIASEDVVSLEFSHPSKALVVLD